MEIHIRFVETDIENSICLGLLMQFSGLQKYGLNDRKMRRTNVYKIDTRSDFETPMRPILEITPARMTRKMAQRARIGAIVTLISAIW